MSKTLYLANPYGFSKQQRQGPLQELVAALESMGAEVWKFVHNSIKRLLCCLVILYFEVVNSQAVVCFGGFSSFRYGGDEVLISLDTQLGLIHLVDV